MNGLLVSTRMVGMTGGTVFVAMVSLLVTVMCGKGGIVLLVGCSLDVGREQLGERKWGCEGGIDVVEVSVIGHHCLLVR